MKHKLNIKEKIFIFLVIIFLLPKLWFLSFAVAGGIKSFSENILKIGSRGDPSNPLIEFEINQGGNNPKVEFDKASQKLRFSNDGTIFQDIGSGGGGAGGLNLFIENEKNFTFDTDVSDWTASGGVFQQETGASDEILGPSASWDPSAAQTLTSDQLTTPNALKGKPCVASFRYKWAGTLTELKLEVIDQALNVLSVIDLDPSTGIRKESIGFTCPSGTDTVAFRLSSTVDTAKIFFDDVFTGERAFDLISQSEIIAEGHIPPNAGCDVVINSTTYVDFPATAACPAPVADFEAAGISIDTSDTDQPTFKVDNLPAGRYLLRTNIIAGDTTAAGVGCVRLSDGTQFSNPSCSVADGTKFDGQMIEGIFTYTQPGDRTFIVQGRSSVAQIRWKNNVGDATTSFRLIRYPLDSQKAFRVETVAWFVNANIGGGSPALGTGAQATYTGLENGTLDLIVGVGSIGVEIGCAGTEESSGLTCSGNESNAISFKPGSAGLVKACVEFSFNTAGLSEAAFQIVETPNNAQTISAEGGPKIFQGANDNDSHSNNICGYFNFTSAKKKTLRLFYEKIDTGGVNPVILGDRNATKGQRDIHWTVKPINQFIGNPLITQSVITEKLLGIANLVSVRINVSGTTCTIAEELGDWLQSATWGNPGMCTITMKTGVFASNPKCFSTARNVNAFLIAIGINSPTSISTNTWTVSPFASTNADFWIGCHGVKQ